MKQCHAPGCSGTTTGYSTLCDKHKQTNRRHGDPLQEGVTVHELRPYVARVEARQAKNKDSNAWTLLDARWEAVTGHCRGIVERAAGGAPYVRHERAAALQVLRLAENVPAPKVVQTALAMYLLLEDRQTRFRSDRAFRFELVRRVRGLTAVNAGEYYDHKAGRTRRVYTDPAPQVVEVMAGWLVEAFGGAGLALAGKERDEAQKASNEQQRLAAAMGGLK